MSSAECEGEGGHGGAGLAKLSFPQVQALLQGKGPHPDRIHHFVRKVDGRVWPSPEWPPHLCMEMVFRHGDDLTAVPESKVCACVS